MTKGMSSLEVWIVMLAALASKSEVLRLTRFFNEWSVQNDDETAM